MKSFELNKLPELMKTNQISTKEGVNLIAVFISENFRVFGLQAYDEDFREEVILKFLEKGNTIFENYDEKIGDFFTFLYSYITNIISGLKKIYAKKVLQENVTEAEMENNYFDDFDKKQFSPYLVQDNKIPYKKIDISVKDFKTAINLEKLTKQEKILLALAIKCSYYLTDDLIFKISKVLNMETEIFIYIIELFNKELEGKIKKRTLLEDHRNKAYFCHKKYESQISYLKQEILLDYDTIQTFCYKEKLKHLEKINEKQIKNVDRLNFKFQNGFSQVKPSNNKISKVTGICERQISYYLFCVRNGTADLAELKAKIEELEKIEQI